MCVIGITNMNTLHAWECIHPSPPPPACLHPSMPPTKEQKTAKPVRVRAHSHRPGEEGHQPGDR